MLQLKWNDDYSITISPQSGRDANYLNDVMNARGESALLIEHCEAREIEATPLPLRGVEDRKWLLANGSSIHFTDPPEPAAHADQGPVSHTPSRTPNTQPAPGGYPQPRPEDATERS